MSLFLSVHAIRRMEQRAITRDELLEALAQPETTYASADDASRTVILGRTTAGRALKMVVETDDHEVVITVADREAER